MPARRAARPRPHRVALVVELPPGKRAGKAVGVAPEHHHVEILVRTRRERVERPAARDPPRHVETAEELGRVDGTQRLPLAHARSSASKATNAAPISPAAVPSSARTTRTSLAHRAGAPRAAATSSAAGIR